MKYIVEVSSWHGDILVATWDHEFDDLSAAIDKAKDEWAHMTEGEKRRHSVDIIESVNPDEEAPDHYDGDFIWQTVKCEGPDGFSWFFRNNAE